MRPRERREAAWQEGGGADIETHIGDAVVSQLQLGQHVPDVANWIVWVS